MKFNVKRRNALIAAFMTVIILFGLMPGAQPVSANTTCDWAQFVSDVTVPDGTTYAAGAAFSKTWRMKNIGTCTWTTGYSLVFVDGSQMGAPASVVMPSSVAPGATVDLTVAMTAPSAAGTYRGNWQLRNASAANFGIGAYATRSFWVEIRVGSTDSGSTGYDFAANAASAVWSSGAGTLTFPGTEGDANGFVRKLDAPVLENGSTAGGAGLLTVPQNVYSGFIQGVYPAFTVQSGDRFQSVINCEYNATSCYVNFRLNYQIDSGPVYTLWSFNERYEGLYYTANIDLSSLAGQNVKFILYVNAYGYSSGDRALWGTPRITRGSGTITPTITPGPSPTPGATSACDRATFIADVNVPDGTVYGPNATFTKTWRIKNTGSCTWTTGYKLVFVSGAQMGGTSPINLASTVGPNTSFDVSVNLTAPATAGSYRGYWQFQNASSVPFGIGYYADKPWWVDIYVNSSVVVPTNTPGSGMGTPVPTSTATPTGTPASSATATPTRTSTPASSGATAFDFTTNPAAAVWTNGSGSVTFGGTDPSDVGVAKKVTSIHLEDNSTDTRASLVLVPQNIDGGIIQGVFPAFAVLNGDHFKTTIGCEYGATTCYARYILDYQIDGDPTLHNLINYSERYEGMIRNVDFDLSALAGQSVKFILKIDEDSGTSGALDRAVWVAPRITR
jgi:hypothetical protein